MSNIRSVVQSPTSETAYFNNVSNLQSSIGSNLDATIIGFFEQISQDKDTARNIAKSVIQTAFNRGLDPNAVFAEFIRMKPTELNGYVTMFLNLDRVGTSFLGISNLPETNKYIKRAIHP